MEDSSYPLKSVGEFNRIQDNVNASVVGSFAFKAIPSPQRNAPRYTRLEDGTDMNTFPLEGVPWTCNLSRKVQTLAVSRLENGEHIDFIAPAHIIKQIFKMTYSDASLSIAVFRVGKTLVLNAVPGLEGEHQTPMESLFLRHSVSSVKSPDSPKHSDLSKSKKQKKKKNKTDKAPDNGMDKAPDNGIDLNINFLQVHCVQFHTFKMILGSDLLVFSDENNVSVSLHLCDTSAQVTPCQWLGAWLENDMAGVQQLDTCYHQNGVVKYYDLLKTDQILLTKAPQFDPNKVYQVGHQFLSFLQEKCNQDPGAYWLQKSAEDNVIHLNYLPVMTKQYPLSDPWPPSISIGRSESLTFFGDLLYPVVQRLTEAPENREKCIEYFQLCSELLNEPRHMVVRASVYGQLARLFLSKSDFPKGLHYIFKGITSLRCARQVQWAEVEVIDRKLWEIVFRLGIYLLHRHAYKRDDHDPSTLVLKVPLEVYEELERIGCRFHYPSSKQMEVDDFLKAGLHCFQQAETALGKLSDDMLKEKGGVYIEIGDGYEVNKKWVDAEGFFSMALNAFRVALDYANIFLVYRKLGGVRFQMANELHLTLEAMWKIVVACPKDEFKSAFKDTYGAAMIHCCKAIEFFSLANSELGNIGNGEANDITKRKSFYSGYAFSYMLLHLLFDLGDKASVCDMRHSTVKIKITDVGQIRMMVMTAEEAMRKCLGILESKGLDVKDRVSAYTHLGNYYCRISLKMKMTGTKKKDRLYVKKMNYLSLAKENWEKANCLCGPKEDGLMYMQRLGRKAELIYSLQYFPSKADDNKWREAWEVLLDARHVSELPSEYTDEKIFWHQVDHVLGHMSYYCSSTEAKKLEKIRKMCAAPNFSMEAILLPKNMESIYKIWSGVSDS